METNRNRKPSKVKQLVKTAYSTDWVGTRRF